MALFDFVSSSFIFSVLCFINDIRVIYTLIWFISRNNYYIQAINLLEFLFLCLSSTSHTRKLIIHTEIILEGYRSKSLAFTFNFNAFFSLNCLMQTF